MTTRGGKSTHDPPYPNHAGKEKAHKEPAEEEELVILEDNREPKMESTLQDFVDTSFLPFSTHSRKMAMDEQFARFVEMIQKIHVNVPLLDVMHVPMYAWYIKDIINSKRPLPTTKVIKLMEECSAPILNRVLGKKKDLGCPMITCSIRTHHFDHTLCDLGASVSVMPKVIFDQLNFTHLSPTPMHLQLADSLVRYPTGITEDILVKIQDYFIPVDFVVLDMETLKEKLLILGQPFLSTAGAHIDVGAREICFNINGKEEKFNFWSKQEQCSIIKIKYGPKPQGIKEVKVTPHKMIILIPFIKAFMKKEEQRMDKRSRLWKN